VSALCDCSCLAKAGGVAAKESAPKIAKTIENLAKSRVFCFLTVPAQMRVSLFADTAPQHGRRNCCCSPLAPNRDAEIKLT
jgi:hypothetical protein